MMKLEDTELWEALEKDLSADQYYDQVVEKIIGLNPQSESTLNLLMRRKCGIWRYYRKENVAVKKKAEE